MPNIVSPKELQSHAQVLSAWAAAVLQGLAEGKYDSQVAVTENLLKEAGVIFPPLLEAEKALEIFLWLNKMTAGRGPIVNVNGTWVTQSWANDPRHALTPEGNFVDGSF